MCIHIDLSFSLVYFFLERDQRYNILLYLQYQEIGQKLSEIGGRLDYPRLTTELAEEIETLWSDAAIQVFYPLTKMSTCLNSLFLSCFFFPCFFQLLTCDCGKFSNCSIILLVTLNLVYKVFDFNNLWTPGNLLTWQWTSSSRLCSLFHGKFAPIFWHELCTNKGT